MQNFKVYEDSLGKAVEKFGPDSKERRMALRKIDQDITKLHERLNVSNMAPHVNIIITSDHGMTSRPDGDKQIEIGRVLRKQRLVKDVEMIVGSGAYTMIYPKEDPEIGVLADPTRNNDRRAQIVRTLKRALKQEADVYKSEDIPDHLHWKVN